MGLVLMNDSTARDGPERSLAALEEVLDLQRRLLDATAEMSWMINRIQSASLADRTALQEQLDELTATLLSYAEQIRTLLVRYRMGDWERA